VSESILVAWWAGSAAYACHLSSRIAEKAAFCRWIAGNDVRNAIGNRVRIYDIVRLIADDRHSDASADLTR
jgi:hypothetical protein